MVDQLDTSISVYDRSGVIADLEDALRDYFGVRHAVLASSGTAALHSSYAAALVEPGDEVIVPAYTFFATATPLLHLGAVPVLADSDETGNVSVEDVANRITERTVAIMVTHLWGIPADVNGLKALADAHGLALLEDASHAHGATVTGRRVGTFGRVSAFSMNGPKPLSAGEGGFALTDNDEVYYRLLLHGHYNKRCRNEIPADHPLHQYAVTGMGLKFRIHPLAARIALDQLGQLDGYLAGRAAIAEYLRDQLGQLPGIAVPTIPADAQPAWYGLPLIYVPDELDGIPIERVHQALLAEGLREVDRPGSTRPVNQLPLFGHTDALFPHHPARAQLRFRRGQFPVAEQVHHHTLKLPVWHREEDMPLVEQYIEGFRKVVEHRRDLQGTRNG
ncbi:DegT/DnrJ/EryC1/StrS family aminotransferase [Actinophytocola sp.]|uniref:DegT/DnrJ/EryC1/StrS family aminotransferase n=1 Tax=Actinophytocola sp. TaxID=1872138 RepID=UPI003D6B2087